RFGPPLFFCAASAPPPWPPRAAGNAPTGADPGFAPVGSPEGADLAGHDAFAEKPELYVGAAFAGGLLVAGVLRYLGR
ncbi:MAG: hypothetical protein AABM29_11255, partial [Actinomycetota bacterium]